MDNYKIRFARWTNAQEISNEAAFDMIEDYWITLSRNGQVVGGFDIFTDCGCFYLTSVTPENDSLEEKYNNGYVKERLKKLKSLFSVDFIREGENLEYNKPCECKKHSWYFLGHEKSNCDSPVICGDCLKPIPLYKIPYIFGEDEHYSLLDWRAAKKALDTLWFHGLWDRFTYAETAVHKSRINREGRRICRALEKALRAPVYYFIYYICKSYDEEGTLVPKGLPHGAPEVCPSCGKEWTDNSKFYKCEKCRLIVDHPILRDEQ